MYASGFRLRSPSRTTMQFTMLRWFAAFSLVMTHGQAWTLNRLRPGPAVSLRPASTFVPAAPLGPVASTPVRALLPSRQRVRLSMGLFGLGAMEIGVIVGVAALIMGPQKLAEMAKSAGKGLGDLKEVPKGFNEGFEQGASSDETKKIAREMGRATVVLKETATDLAGDYSSVAGEFASGLREGAKAVNNDLVGGLQETNKLVAETRAGVKDVLGSSRDAEVVKK